MIYIYTPSTSASGGPELLQQLCKSLKECGYDAQMVYFWSWFRIDPKKNVYDRYKAYGNTYSKKVEDVSENIVVVPETAIYLLEQYKNVKKVIWWLSVDFYNKTLANWKHKCNTFMGMFDKPISEIDAYHMCQSYYAKLFIESKGVESSKVFMVSDYLNDEFIQSANNEHKKEKKDIVLYNPKKGIEFTRELMNIAPHLGWIPIENMTPAQVRDLMQTSKLYIDFGNHPGKDRMPREAAISGCCVITGKRGSANNEYDVRIPEKYKLDETATSYEEVLNKIQYIINNYETCRKDFDEYRNLITHEESVFNNQVKAVFDYLSKRKQ